MLLTTTQKKQGWFLIIEKAPIGKENKRARLKTGPIKDMWHARRIMKQLLEKFGLSQNLINSEREEFTYNDYVYGIGATHKKIDEGKNIVYFDELRVITT